MQKSSTSAVAMALSLSTMASGAATLHTPRKSVAAQQAAALGKVIGNGCIGRADIATASGDWVVLCSNGKSYRIQHAAVQGSSPQVMQCSLSTPGNDMDCFKP